MELMIPKSLVLVVLTGTKVTSRRSYLQNNLALARALPEPLQPIGVSSPTTLDQEKHSFWI